MRSMWSAASNAAGRGLPALPSAKISTKCPSEQSMSAATHVSLPSHGSRPERYSHALTCPFGVSFAAKTSRMAFCARAFHSFLPVALYRSAGSLSISAKVTPCEWTRLSCANFSK